MSVVAPERTHNLEYTNTVKSPVRRNAHHAQLPLRPSVRMISVNRLALLVLVVAATIDMPISHHGMEPADLKYSFAPFDFALKAEIAGIITNAARNAAMMM